MEILNHNKMEILNHTYSINQAVKTHQAPFKTKLNLKLQILNKL